MRIIQLIDSLETGGAERMAVSYANALAGEIEFSGLVSTRKEGALKNQIHPEVSYLFLNKKIQLDLTALLRLRSFILKNEVTHIHAHSTSFFFAFLLKTLNPSLKLIWHYHYGNNQILSKKRVAIFRIVTIFFNGVIAVNKNLKFWLANTIKLKNVIYLPNFPVMSKECLSKSQLYGYEGKRIVSLANLRKDKNHFLLLKVAQKLKISYPDWTFHLVGKDFEDNYSIQIKEQIKEHGLQNNVFLYGSKDDIQNILQQTTVAVLSSNSEGLPVALLEYGLYKKPVVVTHVGEIPMIVHQGKNGFIVNSHDPEIFYQSLVHLIENEQLRSDFGEALFSTIQTNYTAAIVIKKYLNWLEKL